MKKLLILLVLFSVSMLVSCKNEEEPHSHSFVTYVSDGNATCTSN